MTASENDPGRTTGLDDQIRALADRLTALEATVSQHITPPAAAPATGVGTRPAARTLPPGAPAGRPGAAMLRYSGEGPIASPRPGVVRRQESLDTVLGADPALVTRELTALASPIRLVLLRAMLDGPRTSQQLRDVLDAGSAGQLYHHLKELISAGVVIQPARNRYAMPPGKAVAAWVIIMAAAHLAETSHQVPPPPPSGLADNEEP